MIRYLIHALIATVLLVTGRVADAGCNQFFHYKQAVVVAQPQVYYFAGQAVQDEAIIRKSIRAELPAIIQALRQELQQPAQQQTTPNSVLAAKCARCHTGEAAKAGIDFTIPIDATIFRRSVELIGTGRDAPTAMKAVLSSLTPENKGALMEELLQLSATRPAAPMQPAAPPPEPLPVPGVLQ